MGVFLNFTPTDSSYVKRICKGFYDDSQIAEAYRYVMSERENILNFKDESDSYSSELREVKKLYDEGILTKEEFEKSKKENFRYISSLAAQNGRFCFLIKYIIKYK